LRLVVVAQWVYPIRPKVKEDRPDTICSIYNVSRKKETKMFFCNIFYTTQAILIKFGTPFPA